LQHAGRPGRAGERCQAWYDRRVESSAVGTSWTAILAVITALSGAVSVLFGLLNARSNAQLATATDAIAKAETRATEEAAGRAAAEKALADERKERLEYVEARRLESQAEREELQSIVNDIRMVARTQARGGFRQGGGGSGGGAEGSGETGPQPVRRPGGGRTS
jgi:hypothetical protein